jgi:tripartite ATP-independent transporter DctM subunit
MNEIVVGVVGIAMVLFLFLTGIEVGFAMAIVGFLGFSILVSPQAAFNMLAKDFFDVFSSYGLTVIPLFIMMGQVAYHSGIARRLYDTAYKFTGHVPGGLAIATVGGATLFKAVCGSSPATAAMFSTIAVPVMDKYGYSQKLSTGIVAIVGTLGILIPPSVTLIVLGIITEQSIGKLFLAGIIPGLIIALFFVFIIYGWCKINPSIGPAGERSSWKERVSSLPEVVWVLAIFLLIVGGIMEGFFTPTEAGSVGTMLVILLSVAKRGISVKTFIESVSEAIHISCMVLMLVAGSTVLGHFIAMTQIPTLAADWIVSLPIPPWSVMALIIITYKVGGSFVDELAFMILATPIFFPAVTKLGYDPIWFDIMIGIAVMVSVVLPPLAINVFIVKKITKVPFSVIYGGVYPFIIAIVACAILLFIFPGIATYLPRTLMK